MRAVIQRVLQARVEVKQTVIAEIRQGLLLLVGVAEGDLPGDAEQLARKIPRMRIFESPPGKMNLSVLDVKGEILAVPQFTLLADCSHGLRPDFTAAARPEKGRELFEHFCQALQAQGVVVKQGAFQEHMQVSLENDGPVTITLDTQLKN